MINVGKCPKCSKVVSNVKIEGVSVIEGFTPAWHGISLLCPSCNSVLGVSIDPIALKADIVEEMAQRLGR
jgi:phage FluMu protein Com